MPSLPEVIDFLDGHEALRLGEAPDVWPILPEDDDTFEVDWTRLFPTRVADRGFEDWELFGNDDWDLPAEAIDRIGGATPVTSDTHAQAPGWDRCAWYQPIHFHGFAWGLYLYDECIIDVAAALYDALGRPPLTTPLAKTLTRAGFATLFLHEQYHHKTESIAIRLHVVEQRPCYIDYFTNVYIPTTGSDAQIEEGLANADSFYRLAARPYSLWLGRSVRQLTEKYLRRSFSIAPPGYRVAAQILSLGTFDREEECLKAQVQEGILRPARQDPTEFSVASYLNQSLLTISQNIWTIVRKGAIPLLPQKPGWIAPLSRVQVEKLLRREGYVEIPGAGKGSHHRYARDGAASVTLPDVKDLSLPVLRNTAHALGLKNIRELERAIRS
jgi:predicted RNA binding protein YcfA (HicA-like mRNA interferase family)